MSQLRAPAIIAKPGDILGGRYRLEQPLGEGGMGIVFAAEHIDLKEAVAIKILHPKRASDEAMVARFVREGRTAVKIRSEHVARVFDVGTDGGVPYLVMELLTGEDLAVRLGRDGALSVPIAIEFILQACEALASAHGLGVVHRDLKPSNLFVAENTAGEPSIKVLDFGISKVTEVMEGPAVTTTSEVLGSPGYMSPEQMRATRDVDLRTDIWSLGMILWEMVVGRSMFGRCTFPELCAKVLGGTVLHARDAEMGIPDGLSDVIDRCLALDPNDRFPTVAALADALVPFGSPDASVRAARVARVSRVASDRQTASRSQRPPPLNFTEAPTVLLSLSDRDSGASPSAYTSSPKRVPLSDGVETRTATPMFRAPDTQTGEPSSITANSAPLARRSTRTATLIGVGAAFVLTAVFVALRTPSSPTPAAVSVSAPSIAVEPSAPGPSARPSPSIAAPESTGSPRAEPLAPSSTAHAALPIGPIASAKAAPHGAPPIASAPPSQAVSTPAMSAAPIAPATQTPAAPANGAPILR